MKKSTKLMVALLVIVAALAVTYRLMNRVPSADLEANAQMQQIITDAGCLRCHTSNPDLPFYANMPVAGKIVMEDVSKAYRAFDMTRMAADLKAGNPVDQVALAKVEKGMARCLSPNTIWCIGELPSAIRKRNWFLIG